MVILVTGFSLRMNKERWKYLILRDVDKYLKFRSILISTFTYLTLLFKLSKHMNLRVFWFTKL